MYDTLIAESVEREEIRRDNAVWTTNHPHCRLYMCMVHDDVRAALMTMYDALDRPALDARNSDSRPRTFWKCVTDLYNDESIVLTTEALPELHKWYSEPRELHFSEMPGGEITAEQVKTRFGESRAKLIQIIYDWEKSGNGFGQRTLDESAWGRFTTEHMDLADGDNRAHFLKGDSYRYNKEHLLYLWHLADTLGILSNMLNVLSKEVAVDCDALNVVRG